MLVYKNEINDGLAEKVVQDTTLAYYMPVRIVDSPIIIPDNDIIHSITKASSFDLFPLESILATVGWNINTDIFTKEEMWNARATPVNKPFNLEHRGREIIGHITASRAVDADYNTIDDNTPFEDVPDVFHILTAAVIYKAWEDKSFQDQIQKIVAEIQAGEWYVSMECLFRGFDYGLIAPDGSKSVKARDESSAFLTKHLRQYGGVGEYQGYKLGRVLRNMTFSGKGLVRNPANPDSVIFNNVSSFASTKTNLVYFKKEALETQSTESHEMNEVETLNKLIAELRAENERLVKASAENDVKAVKAQVDVLAGEKASLTKEIEGLKELVALAEKKVKDIEDGKTKAETDAAEAAKKSNDYENESKKMFQAKTKAERLLAMIKPHVNTDAYTKAESLVEVFAGLDDESFDKAVKLTVGDAMNTSVPDNKPIVPVVMKGNPLEVPPGAPKSAVSTAPQQNTRQANADILENVVPEGDQTSASVNTNPTVADLEKARASAISDTISCYLNTTKK